MTDPRLQELISRYLDNELSPGELRSLLELLKNDPAARSSLDHAIEQALEGRIYESHAPGGRADALFRNVLEAAAAQEKEAAREMVAKEKETAPEMAAAASAHRTGRILRRMAVAAVTLAALAVVIYRYTQRSKEPVIQNRVAATAKAHAPQAVTLTLSDGASISLDSTGNGAFIQQGQTQILNRNGQLTYTYRHTGRAEPVYNTINIPRGRDYRLVLPDGSKVWLNAASSLRFPVAFTGNERKVELTGEAYFEVAGNPGMPFRVAARDMEITVLGTAFNISAYGDEHTVSSTLVSGSVKVSAARGSVVLNPGQQASLGKPGGSLEVQQVDISTVTAWKDGYFRFDGADMGAIVRQMARWYDVEPDFRGPLPEGHYRGKLPRTASLEEFLKVLQLNGIAARVEDGKIILSTGK